MYLRLIQFSLVIHTYFAVMHNDVLAAACSTAKKGSRV